MGAEELNNAIGKDFEFPENPKRYQVFIAPDGSRWQFDQSRDEDGTFTSDDPETEVKESALHWILKPNN